MKELRADWGDTDSDSADSESDIDELNAGFMEGWDYTDNEDEDVREAVDEETQDQQGEDDRNENNYQPGRIKLKNRLVNSLESCLEQNNYDR